MFHESGDDEAIRRLSSLYLRNGTAFAEYRIEWLRIQKRTPIIKLYGVEDRASAESLIDSDVFAMLSESRPKEEGTWLVSDLVGLEVFIEEESGPSLGRVKAVINNPAHDILEIETGDGTGLLPLIDAFVTMVDTDNGIMKILPPEGWLEH